MSTIQESVDVLVPLRAAYNQWTQFEEFPRFMEAVDDVRQLDDTHLRWHATVGRVGHVFEAEIVEQRPDERIAWRSIAGDRHAGVVTFHRLGADETRIMVQIESEPQGVIGKLGDALGFLRRQVKRDLDRFRRMIEARRTETGAWRGEVRRPNERKTAETPRGSAANVGRATTGRPGDV